MCRILAILKCLLSRDVFSVRYVVWVKKLVNGLLLLMVYIQKMETLEEHMIPPYVNFSLSLTKQNCENII